MMLLASNTEIYENYSAVLQKQSGPYFFLKQFLLTRIMINSAILMIEWIYENKKECQSPLLEIDTLSFYWIFIEISSLLETVHC